MKKTSIVTAFCVFCLCVTETSFAFWDSHPKLDEKHVQKDLIGRQVQGWTFREGAPCRVKIVDGKYEKDTALVYVFIRSVDRNANSGREGKLRLEYEYAADDWNLINVKAISYVQLDHYAVTATAGHPLLAAADEGDVDMVKSLIAEGADVNVRAKYGKTALIFAAVRGHLDVAEMLLANSAEVNVRDDDGGWTALHMAAARGRTRLVQLLLEIGADVNARDKRGQTPLISAACNSGNLSTLKALLEKGADVNAKDQNGWTPLLSALFLRKGDVPVVKVLVENGADVNAKTSSGETPLTVGRRSGYEEIIQILEKDRAD